MRVRVACDADPMCGSSTVRGALEQPRVHLGLALEHVEPGREQPAGVQRVGERLLVDHRAARGVHEHRGRLHEREPARVDEVPGRVAAGHVQRHDVGRGEQLVEVGDVAGLAGVGARVVQHLHPEAGRAARDRAADAAVADDAERRAVHVATEVLRDRPSRASGRRAGRLRRRARAATRRGSSVNARSAVVSSSTPGVLHTTTPCSRAAATSMLS